MEDFNRMCANIDTGLGGIRDTAAQNKSALSERIGSVEQNAADALQRGLFRLAYNYYWLAAAREDPICQRGIVRQVFGKDKGNWSGLELLADRARLYNNGGEALTMDSVRDSLEVSEGYSSDAKLAPITFTAHCAGRLTALVYYGHVRENPGDPGDCTVKLTNLTLDQVEAEARACFHFTKGSSTLYRPLEMDLPLHSGCRYKVEVILDSTAANHQLWFQKNYSDGSMRFAADSHTAFSHSWQLQAGEPSLGGLGLVRYRTYGNGGIIKLNWDGVSYTASTVRTITDGQGRTVQEAEFRRTSAVPANSRLTLNVTCPVGGELELFEMGAVLI